MGKCVLFKSTIPYYGLVIVKQRRPNATRIEAIQKLKIPTADNLFGCIVITESFNQEIFRLSKTNH